MIIASICLILLGGFFVVMNWACLITSLVTKKNHSMVPPFGGMLVAGGLAFLPAWQRLFWLGLLIDIGFWAMLAAMPSLIQQARRSSKSRLELSLVGRSDGIEVSLSLFRPDDYQITVSSASTQFWSRGSLGTWTRQGHRFELVSHTDKPDHPARAVLMHHPDRGEYEVTESTFTVPSSVTAPEYPPANFRFVATTKAKG